MEALKKFQKSVSDSLEASLPDILIETIPDGVFVIDRSARIILWNKSLESISGYEREEVLDKHPSLLEFQYRNGEVCPNNVEECGLFVKGEIKDMECMLRHKNGWFVPVLKNARVLQDKNGEIIGAVESVTDITAVEKIKRRAENEQKKLHHSLGNIVGESAPMQNVYEAVSRAADASNATVLVQGESGTGKELVAGAIHYQSERAAHPFILVNCSALPEAMLESELFGHVKGAFTGALKDRAGRFEEADGGTLLLDEIGDISPAIQVKLLRVLQDHVIEKIGESKRRQINIRVIAATNKDLEALVKEGRFRSDLYFRLKVFTIDIPALRDHKSDIPLLVEHFIKRFNRENNRNIYSISEEALRVLMEYHWPGNVRELENAIEHAFVICKGSQIELFDLPVEVRRIQYNNSANISKASELKQITREGLISLLEECEWNKSMVGRRLGCSHTTVWKYMKKWDIPLNKRA
ncbi:MAG: sigma 54-interacting transcriptional regulator [bacterium]